MATTRIAPNAEQAAKDREFLREIRRAVMGVIACRERDDVSKRNTTINAFFQVLSAIERYTGAQFGLSPLLKPLLLEVTDGMDDDAAYDFFARLVAAIECRYTFTPYQRR